MDSLRPNGDLSEDKRQGRFRNEELPLRQQRPGFYLWLALGTCVRELQPFCRMYLSMPLAPVFEMTARSLWQACEPELVNDLVTTTEFYSHSE